MALSPIYLSWVLKSFWVDCRVIEITCCARRRHGSWIMIGSNMVHFPLGQSRSWGQVGGMAHLRRSDPSLTHCRPHLNRYCHPETLRPYSRAPQKTQRASVLRLLSDQSVWGHQCHSEKKNTLLQPTSLLLHNNDDSAHLNSTLHKFSASLTVVTI